MALTAIVSIPDTFDLDVTVIEKENPAGLINMTDDNCGSTCGACTTNAG